MALTLDYNCEIFPLEIGQNVVLALASSLARDPTVSQDGTVEEDRDRDVWRPDGKGRRGFEDDYDYVMYGRVYRFDPGNDDDVYVLSFYPSKRSDMSPSPQDCIRIVWRIAHVLDRVLPSHDEHCAWRPCISVNAKVVPTSADTRKAAYPSLGHTVPAYSQQLQLLQLHVGRLGLELALAKQK
jgi:hypothetical protein